MCIRDRLDTKRVKQILNNFLSNALKHTQEGYIDITYGVTEQGIEIKVTAVSYTHLDVYKRQPINKGFQRGRRVVKGVVKKILPKGTSPNS